MSTIKSKKVQLGTDANSANNFTLYQPAVPDGTLRIGVGNADSPTEVGKFDSNGYVATKAPAFGAYQSSAQSIANLTDVKITFDVEEFDLTGDFDNTTNYRFTPSVEGYYQINGRVQIDSTNDIMVIKLFKNGTQFKLGVQTRDADSASGRGATVSSLVYANGTTDYFEIYVVHNGGSSKNTNGAQWQTWFNGFLARAV